MTNDLAEFTFESEAVRVIHINDQPWWVVTDLAKVLGYRDANKMLRMLDEDQKGTHKVGTLGGIQEVSIINESGMWTCVIKSQRPEAKAFQRLLTSEILPSLRKEGFYALPGVNLARPLSVAEFLRVGNALKKETNRKLRAELWTRYEQITGSWGIPRGERIGIGYDEPDYSEMLAEFWAAVRGLGEVGIEVNFSRRNDLIALNLPDLRTKFADVGIAFDIGRAEMNALRHSKDPRFLGEKAVNCHDGKARFCWVFSTVPELPLEGS